MRINKFVANASGLSRRAADAAISNGRVLVNGKTPEMGQDISMSDLVTMDRRALQAPAGTTTIMLNKPAGYVVSRAGQGNRTMYDLLPPEYHQLKPVGRLDKDSSGLLLLTNDGELANQLTHPRYAKQKVYEIELDKTLGESDLRQLEQGVQVDDYVSKLAVSPLEMGWRVTMTQGKNRQIRKTFSALGYTVTKLHRLQFGEYELAGTASGAWQAITSHQSGLSRD